MSGFPFNNRWLKDFQQSPIHVADIGGAGGLQGRWKEISPFLRAFLFEPDPRSFAALDRSNDRVTYVNAALGSQPETKTLHLTRKPTCSSLYPPNDALLSQFPDGERYDVVGESTVTLTTLDALQAAGTVPRIDFMKMDVQGYELEILRGASKAVDEQALGLEVEVEFQPMYAGQPLFCDIHGVLAPRGYDLLDLRFGYWKRKGRVQGRQSRGQIIYADALYMRNVAAIVGRIGAAEAEEARRICLHAAGLHTLYGYDDRAWDILNCRRDLFTGGERRDIDRAFAPANVLHRFFMRHKIYITLLRIANCFDPARRGHFKVSPIIGNLFDWGGSTG